MKTQRLIDQTGEIYATVPVLAGPHTWKVSGHIFSTTLCKTPDSKPGELSIIDVRSGGRVGRVKVKAPKTRPYEAMAAVSQFLDDLNAKFGDEEVARRIREAQAA